MSQRRFLFPLLFFASALLVFAAVTMFSTPVSAVSVASVPETVKVGPLAEKAIAATSAYKTAEEELKGSKANVAEYKKLLSIATKFASTNKTDEAKKALESAKADVESATMDLNERTAILAKTKKVMDAALKLAKPEITAATEAALLPGKIACVGVAVNERESTLLNMRETYTEAVTKAYKIREDNISALFNTATTAKELKDGNKSIWSTWKNSMKIATKEWKNSSAAAWNGYKTAIKSCKALADQTDSANSVMEAKGE